MYIFLVFFRLKTVRRCHLVLSPGRSGPLKPRLKRQQVAARERKLSRRPCWLCSAVFWRSSVRPWQHCSTSHQTAARYSWTRSACLFRKNFHFRWCLCEDMDTKTWRRIQNMLSVSLLVCQSMDLAEYRTLFVLSFTTPAFDPDVAPSFGTLLATINVALSMLSEVDF